MQEWQKVVKGWVVPFLFTDVTLEKENMKLKEFLEKFVEPNSLIRLWHKSSKSGYIFVYSKDQDVVSMEWEILKGEGPYKDYVNNEVIGIKDILVDKSSYAEAINIVIV